MLMLADYRNISLSVFFTTVAIFGLSIFVAGCQRDYVPPGELVEVRGRILFDKHPVSDARIVFVPESVTLQSKFLISYGVTNGKGEFELETSDNQEGVLAGKHRVIVSRAKKRSGQSVSPLENLVAKLKPEKDTKSEVNEVWSILEESIEQHDGELIPFYYNVHSELNCEVIPGIGIQEIQFELSSMDPKLKEPE